jgi:alcohol dehydrogenase class IV
MNSKYIKKLIANDIVDFGIKETDEFNYIVALDSYEKDKDSEFINYVNNNIEDIKEEIELNKNVADLEFNKEDKTFDMVFYIDSVLDRVEKIIYTNTQMLDENFELSDIREIADNILDDDAFNEDVFTKIKYYKGGYEL